MTKNNSQNAPNFTTPLQEFTHRENNSRITLVGMVHVAQTDYYHSIQKVVAEHQNDGAVVHFESYKRATPEELERAPFLIAHKARRLREFVNKAHSFLRDTLHLTAQRDGLLYYDDWERHDATELAIAEQINAVRFTAQSLVLKGLFSLLSKANPETRFDTAVDTLKKRAAEPDNAPPPLMQKIIMGGLDRSILDYRNDIALRAVDCRLDIESDANLVLLWGAAHLPGLGEGLISRGYQQTDEQRLTAIDWELFHQTTPRPASA